MTDIEKWQLYAERKQDYLDANPNATPQEIENFCNKLAEQLNL